MEEDKYSKNIKDDQFANVIYKIRTKRNLTQKAFADLIQVSDRTISKWENGLTVPDLINVRSICKELHVSPKFLVLDRKTFKDYLNSFIRKIKLVLDYIFKNIFAIGFIIAFILLLLYFVNNYNSVTFYTLKNSNDNVTINQSYFLKSKGQNILAINNISLKGIEYDILETYLELYTYVNGDKYIICKSDNLDDIYIEELNGYKELLKNDVIKAMKNNLYLDIYTIDSEGKKHNYNNIISLTNKFSNNQISYQTFSNNDKYDISFLSYISKETLAYSIVDDIKRNYDKENVTIAARTVDTVNDKLIDLGYEFNNFDNLKIYSKSDGKGIIKYNNDNKVLEYEKIIDGLRYNLKYYINYNRIDFKIFDNINHFILFLKYYSDINKTFCINGNCEKYLSEIDHILSIYEEIESTL